MATKKTRFTAFRTNRGDTQHYTQQRSFLFFRFHLRYSDYRSVARKESWFQPILDNTGKWNKKTDNAGRLHAIAPIRNKYI